MLRTVAALGLTVALGLLSRLRPVGWPLYDKSLGDVLYAVAVYCVLALFLPRWRRAGSWRLAVVALAVCLAIEFFQATGLPAQWARAFPPVRWVLGTTFAWHDVACYAVGIACAFGVHRLCARILPRRSSGPRTACVRGGG
jgi:hypothetical protein